MLGGCGFIGSHIVDRLVARGYSVRVLDRSPERYRPPVDGATYTFGDMRDAMVVLEALADVEMVFHLISATFPGTAALDPAADVRDNVLPTLSLLEAMTRSGVERLLYLSSGGTVYGIPEVVPTPEDHPLRPISSYGIVKVCIEHFIELHRRTRGLRPVVIRPSNPYGPRQGHVGVQGVVTTFLQRVARDEPIEVWGDGSVVRDYLHVEDLARLCVEAAEAGQEGTFNGGSGQGTSVREIIAHVEAAIGRRIEPVFRPARMVDVPRSILDMSRAERQLGWRPQIGLREGIAASWDWTASL